jgi:ABC-2 type transport system permease protein
MTNALRLYGRYIGISFRGQMQYRVSFLLQTLGVFLVTGIEFLGVWALFQRFGNLRGWTLAEAALFYGLVNVTYSIADAMGRGFDWFAGTIKAGDFDRVLLRPRSTVLQLTGQELTLRRVGRFSQGLAVLIWAAHALSIQWTAPKVLLLAATAAGGACLFFGLLILQATTCFWTIEGLEIWNSLTSGGVYAAQYPLSIYRSWFRKFFLFVVPLGCVAYLPVIAILGKPDPLGSPAVLQWLSPAAGVIFLLISLRGWHLGVRHYTSTGS